MKYIHSILCGCFPVLLILSCTSSEKYKLITGNWAGVEWLANGQPSEHNVKETRFSFDEKGNYIYEYAGTKEEGTYKIDGDMLFTTPKGEQEMAVKITKLTKDSLVFSMNRSGQPEILTLLKK